MRRLCACCQQLVKDPDFDIPSPRKKAANERRWVCPSCRENRLKFVPQGR